MQLTVAGKPLWLLGRMFERLVAARSALHQGFEGLEAMGTKAKGIGRLDAWRTGGTL